MKFFIFRQEHEGNRRSVLFFKSIIDENREGGLFFKKSKRKEKDLSIIKSSEIKQKLHTKYLNSPVYLFKQHEK